jgi:hypothetical protein
MQLAKGSSKGGQYSSCAIINAVQASSALQIQG